MGNAKWQKARVLQSDIEGLQRRELWLKAEPPRVPANLYDADDRPYPRPLPLVFTTNLWSGLTQIVITQDRVELLSEFACDIAPASWDDWVAQR